MHSFKHHTIYKYLCGKTVKENRKLYKKEKIMFSYTDIVLKNLKCVLYIDSGDMT